MGYGADIPVDPSHDPLNAASKELDAFSRSNSDSDPRPVEQIARSAHHLTGASGAALAVSDGSSMSCRACSGYLAPPVGTPLNIDRGLTAACVQTGEIVRCDDTQTDSRADASKCGAARSILAVPIFNGSAVAGVLEVLSSKPHRFTERHATALQLLARLVETHLNYAPRENAPLTASASDTKLLPDNAVAPVSEEPARVGCLSCGNRNPQGSQFCNRCGVILFGSPDPWDKTTAFGLPLEPEPAANEGLKEIYKLISENIGQASWQDISAKLHEKLQTLPPQDALHPAATKTNEVARGEDTLKRFGTRGVKEFTSPPAAAIRRSPWR